MKISKMLGMAVMIGLIGPVVSNADDLFRMSWKGTVYTTSGTTKVAARKITEKDFVNKVAADNGIDPRQLVFVYRPDKHDTAVVMLTNGEFVADVIQMEYSFTEASNANQTQTVRQAFLFDENHESALGSSFGTERL